MDQYTDATLDELCDVAIIVLLAACVYVVALIEQIPTIARSPSRHVAEGRQQYIAQILIDDKSCINMMRMDRNTFYTLVDIMRSRKLLNDTFYISIEEQLLMFLYTIGHDQGNTVLAHHLMRSRETISKYFGKVLKKIALLKDTFIKPPNGEIQAQVRDNQNFWPFFKDCVGAIDVTHIPATVPSDIVAKFQGRYHTPTQNVMAVVRSNLQFSYVLAGWEGSVNDTTILRNALQRPSGLRVPEGKYFLVDAGHTTHPGFIAPYREVRYHLKEFSAERPPITPMELFNFRHSSLCTTVERAFGILKQRFRILNYPMKCSFPAQVDIVLVCCLLHNMIMQINNDDDVVREFTQREAVHHEPPLAQTTSEMRNESLEWVSLRDQIANAMWERDYACFKE